MSGLDGLHRAREQRFVENLGIGLWRFMDENGREPKRKELKAIARTAAVKSGYAYPGHGEQLIKLDRIQHALHESFNCNGLGIDESTKIIADIARDGMIDGKRNDGVRLQAVRLRFALTTGFAPSKSANLQVHARADHFFENNKEKFAKPPPIDATEGQEA